MSERVASLRLDYRYPNVLHAYVLEVLVGGPYPQHYCSMLVVRVGHSFGGAVVIAAGTAHPHVASVVA